MGAVHLAVVAVAGLSALHLYRREAVRLGNGVQRLVAVFFITAVVAAAPVFAGFMLNLGLA